MQIWHLLLACSILFLLKFWTLKLWLLVYKYIVLGNRGKPGIFCLTYRPHSSSVDCARELFKPLKDSASLRVCNKKNVFLVLSFGFFVSDVISKVGK